MKLLQNSKLLALIIFAYGMFQRILVDIAFWEKFGWHSSHLTEVWFYAKMAAASHPFGSTQDITLYLLRLIGLTVPEQYLLHAVSIFAAALSSFTAVVIFYLVRNVVASSDKQKAKDYFIPLAAAFFYTGISSTQALSIISFTHDLLQMPIMLGFLAIVIAFLNKLKKIGWKKGWKKTWYYLLVALILAYLGYNLNPVFLIAVPLLIIYLIFRFLPQKKKGIEIKGLGSLLKRIDPQIVFYILLIVVLILLRYVFYEQVLGVLNNFMLKYRNIDLIHLLGQNSKDMVPTQMDKKFLDLYVLSFFIPFGLYAAYREREGIGTTLLIISYFLAATVDRGSRLLNIGAAIVASYAFWYKKKFFILDYVMTGVLIIAFIVNPGNKILKNFDKVIYIILPLLLLWAFKKYFQKYTKIINRKVYLTAILILLLAPSFLTCFLYKYWFKPALSEGEYKMAQWVKTNAPKGEKIFFNWGEEHYYGFLTGLDPVNDLAGTGVDRDRIYWEPRAEALAYAREVGIRYILVNSSDFGVFEIPNSEQLGYRFRGAPPSYLPTDRLLNSFIYDLVYKPTEIEGVELIHVEVDEVAQKWVRLFEIQQG